MAGNETSLTRWIDRQVRRAQPDTGASAPWTSLGGITDLLEAVGKRSAATKKVQAEQGAIASTAQQKAKGKGSTLTGTNTEIFQTLQNDYLQAEQDLFEWEAGFQGITARDPDSVVVWELITDPQTGNVTEVPNMEGTKLFKALMNAGAKMADFSELVGEGIAGAGTAMDYLSSESTRISEAQRQFDDYLNRVAQVANIEAAEGAKSDAAATAVTAGMDRLREDAEARAAAPASPFTGQVIVSPGAGPRTDLTQFSDAIRETIPGAAPAAVQMNPASYAPTGGGTLTWPPPREAISVGSPGQIPTISASNTPRQNVGNLISALPQSPVTTTLSDLLRMAGF